MRPVLCAVALVHAVLFAAQSTWAQYAEVPRPLPAPIFSGLTANPFNGRLLSAVQIGRRLFVAGAFDHLAPRIGGVAVVNPAGQVVAGAFPPFHGAVSQILADGVGGWFVVGDFTQVDGRATSGFARVTASRTIDARFLVAADGPVKKVAVAHGRVYLVGDFTVVQGLRRAGLAALDAGGAVTSWGAAFQGGASPNDITTSSIGVYVGALGSLWGLEASSGRVWFSRAIFFTGMAASSQHVFLGRVGLRRPISVVDPITGTEDTNWSVGVTFEFVQGAYGQDATQVTALLLDGGRLYAAGRFRTTDGRESLLAVDAGSGAPIAWRPSAPRLGSPKAVLSKVGPFVTAIFEGDFVSVGALHVYDAGSAAALPFAPAVVGAIRAVALAPEGALLGGDLTASGGIARQGLASIDLDTFAVEPWTSAFAGTLFNPVQELASDGTWLFARTEGSLGGVDAALLKIDPSTGAVVAQRTFPSVQTRMRVSGGQVVLATTGRNGTDGEVGLLDIATWSYQALPATVNGTISTLDVDATTIYVGGTFVIAPGVVYQPELRAIDRVSGDWTAWRPRPDGFVTAVRVAAGRVWASGQFQRVGGLFRRGLVELDPATAAPTSWNPDVSGPGGVNHLAIDAVGGVLIASTGLFGDPSARSVAAGQLAASELAYSMATGERLPWRPGSSGMIALTPDCLLVAVGCLPRAEPSPFGLQVGQTGAATTLSWALPASASRTGVRLEFGRTEGRADLAILDLPPDSTSFSAPAPPGRYVARVRALAGAGASLTTADVSFAVGAPAAPLNVTAIAERRRVALAWQAPSTGAPAAYELQAGSRAGQTDIGRLTLAGAATSIAVDGVPIGQFWLRVAALDSSGRGAPSLDVFVDSMPRQTCSTSPPQQLAATVTGRIVTLTWQPPADGSDDIPRLVVGSAPGLRDLATLEMPPYATSYAVPAPPGTYYARLEIGCLTTSASNEVRIDVP